MNVFSHRLKLIMKGQDITQTQLVEITGLGKSSISQYCSGKNIPSKANLKTIANALDVSEEWLLGKDQECDVVPGQKNITVETAAKLMGVGRQFIRVGLQNKSLPFGTAVKMPSGKYRYYISPSKFSEFTGCEV